MSHIEVPLWTGIVQLSESDCQITLQWMIKLMQFARSRCEGYKATLTTQKRTPLTLRLLFQDVFLRTTYPGLNMLYEGFIDWRINHGQGVEGAGST